MPIRNIHPDDNFGAYVQDDLVQSILQRQLEGLPSKPKGTVLNYVGRLDLLLLVISIVSATLAGALNPLLTIIYGLVVRSFQRHANGEDDGSKLSSNVSKLALFNVYVGIAEFVLIYVATVGFYYTGERITRNLRRAYLRAIIRQNIAFFDTLSPGEVTARITSDMNIIQEGITSKISTFLTALATFISAEVIAFLQSWKLALMLFTTTILIGGAEFLGAMYAMKFSRRSSAALNEGSSVVEETLSSMRHVFAYGIQDAMRERYMRYIDIGERWGLKARLSITFMIGVMNSVPYLSYALAFWQGSRYVVMGDMSASAVVITTMAIIIGSFAVGRVAPSAESFVKSIVHSGAILKAIARQSPLDPLATDGQSLPSVHGDLELHDVSLAYPSRQTVQVLDQISMRFPANKTTALVGASGCGKSSIVGLLERFYEPTGGYITLDGVDLTLLNLHWLRQQMSYVVQEPVLFNRSIFDNIMLGLKDLDTHRTMLEARELVHAAARVAHAHDFIMALPQGYHTEVGTKGLHLSGGQRQRICIARAVISNPKILLLDEATSALDSKSEKAVQLALNSAARDRTTIVIAHRLSTIRNADNIIVMDKGVVLEQGEHEELMSLKGVYARLVETQQIDSETEDETIDFRSDTETTLSDGKTGPIQVSPTSDFVYDSIANGHERLQDSSPSFRTYFRVVSKLNRKEAPLIFAGLLLCVLTGFVIPAQAISFAESISAITLAPEEYHKLFHEIKRWSIVFAIIAIFAFVTWISQGICFSRSTERLTHNTRHEAFRSILSQDIAFFDEKRNSPGALTSFVSTTATDITGLSGPIIGSSLTFLSTLTICITVSLVVGWKLALVCTSTIPFVAGCGYVRLRVLALFDHRVRKTHEEAAMFAMEIITAIRSVASLTLEQHFLDEYTAILSREAAQSRKSILKASALYAASHSFTFFCGALAFWYGGTLLAKNEYTILQFYICFGTLISGAQIAGAVVSYAPDMSKALHAGQEMYGLFNRTQTIDARDATCQQHPTLLTDPHAIEFQNVSFNYPSRPSHPVLQNFSLTIQPGQFIALVGPSGSGKTTVLQLLERFYRPTAGRILLSGVDISELDVHEYRKTFALVSQEPILYDGTIRENLLLCGVDTPTSIDDQEIVNVCKEANIDDFILSLPDGLNTRIGTAGTMLSGGQKQRLALARALLRNSPVLLLDEATSALDSAAERLVQEALDRAADTRTTVAVTHRLRTVQRADLIVVMEHGAVVERGSHAELMARRGLYWEMVGMQRFEVGVV
ncbi:multidrug resistance protein [Aspergillus saccharolyticus JOP 1030-1]|uniref:ABC multidrug transporter MDR2 n=1 Tax=Aspergillus saccharolyticus JOP 1030-1 TaxID=1450539 RepID=A0A318Z8S0_9EURO|nr:multidrug resistance protein [Aspergillus saccharolyticus JOP 1030-1]PYH43656.1 multidrug resistance protein [Aspergillus saccharolyticus JOP 1030-1]